MTKVAINNSSGCRSCEACGEVAQFERRHCFKCADKMNDEMRPDEFSKQDSGKTRFDLLPPDALSQIADVLAFGADKYGEYNWARGSKWSRFYGAVLRHVFAWWGGEDKDPETGLSHLAHAACGLIFLLSYESRGNDGDDRPGKVGANE